MSNSVVVGKEADGTNVMRVTEDEIGVTTGRTVLDSSRAQLEWDIQSMNVLLPNEADMPIGQADKDEYFSTFKPLRSPTFKTHLGSSETMKSEQSWFLQLCVGNHKLNTYSPTEERFVSLFLHYYKEGSIMSTVDPLRLLVSICIRGEEKDFVNNSFTIPFATIKAGGGLGYQKFISLKNLWDNRKTHLVNNILRIKAEVVVFGSPVLEITNTGCSKSMSPVAANKFVDDMRQLFKSGRDSDITIKCGGKAFLVHSAILKGRNLVFERMLESGMKEFENKIIKIEDVDPVAFETFLEFIYTAQVELQKENMDKIFGLVRVADKYGVVELKDTCFRFIQEHMTMSNAGEIAVLSYQHNANDYIRSRIVNFCQSNWSELAKLPNFKRCVNESPMAFFDKTRKRIKLDLEVESEDKEKD